MDTMANLSPEAIEAINAMGLAWKQMTSLEKGYFLGEIHGMLKAQKEPAEKQ